MRVRQALDRSEPLGRLQALLGQSRARFETIRPALPPELIAHVRAIPSDEAALTLLAENPAVAAKLRQWLPRLETLLTERGDSITTIQVKLKTR